MTARSSASMLEHLAHFAAVVAIVVSLVALYGQRDLEHESYTQTLIHDQYELCRVLDEIRVRHPEVSHMLALPVQNPSVDAWANYQEFKHLVRSLFDDDGSISRKEQATLYLQEHAMALHVADIYEQSLYQLQLATQSEDERRAEVLRMLCQYYEQRMLRNPRLRFHWDHGVSDMMEADTRRKFDLCVRSAFPDDPVDTASPLD